MAGSWGDLLQSIEVELNRDDLKDLITSFAQERIRHYQRDFYYATPLTYVLACVPGQAFYEVPTDMVSIKVIRLDNAGSWQVLAHEEYDKVLLMDTNIPSTVSVPTVWAQYDGQFRLYQVPDDTYPLELSGSGRIPCPTLDKDSNFWTTDAAELIRCATIAQLFLRRIKDPDLYKAYAMAAEEVRIGLVQETIAKTTDNLIRAWW